MWLIIGALILITILIKIYLDNVYNYWKKRNIPTAPYQYFFGNYKNLILMKKSPGQLSADMYNLKEFKDLKYFGMYKCLKPGLVLRSPDVIKDVLVSNFDCFYNNDFEFDENVDVIFGRNPVFLKDSKWREVKNQITPNFSPSKVKTMNPLLVESCKKLLIYLDNTKECENEVGVECKELCSNFTCDNVASCSLGIDSKALVDPNSRFRSFTKNFSEPSMWSAFLDIIMFVYPKLATLLRVKVIPGEDAIFLRQLIRETIKFRTQNNLEIKDVMGSLCKTRQKINDETKFNEDDILAHIGGFIFDGIETTSAGLSFTLYELAENPHIQDRLKEEIDQVLEKYNGELTTEAISEMKYLTCIIKESLRKHPAIPIIMKVCTKPYKMPPIREDGTGPQADVEVGTTISIPFHAIQMDPQYFPDPETFNPDRFSDENKDNITQFTYLPFGKGPRQCLGMNFGMQQMKMMLITLVDKYEMRINKKTKKPLVIDPKSFMSEAVGGIWLNFYKRNK